MLDLRRDKYLAVDGCRMDVLATRIPGWPPSPRPATNAESHDSQEEAFIQRMLQEGLVTRDMNHGKTATPVKLELAIEPLTAEDARVHVPVRLVQVLKFLTAAAIAATALRWRTLESVVRAVEARKAKHAAQSGIFPIDAARNAVRVYERLRPLVFTSRDACLFDSLALLEYLSFEHVFPFWVIGVRTGPFGAHSWLQQDGIVLNDTPERVRKFTPILAV